MDRFTTAPTTHNIFEFLFASAVHSEQSSSFGFWWACGATAGIAVWPAVSTITVTWSVPTCGAGHNSQLCVVHNSDVGNKRRPSPSPMVALDVGNTSKLGACNHWPLSRTRAICGPINTCHWPSVWALMSTRVSALFSPPSFVLPGGGFAAGGGHVKTPRPAALLRAVFKVRAKTFFSALE